VAERAGRRGFGVTIGLAALGGVVAAVGGNHAWAEVDAGSSFAGASAVVITSIERATAPLVTALALVVLAAYGVLLVTRGVVRRLLAVLAAVAALGLVVSAVGAFVQAPREVTSLVGPDGGEVHRTAWAPLSVAASVLLLAVAVVTVLRVRDWPEMGRRYDAPGGGEAVPVDVPVEEQTSLDLWRTIDEGRDPTRTTDRQPPHGPVDPHH
jgi:uncharacterized membrane protein (TIGR02234 family)